MKYLRHLYVQVLIAVVLGSLVGHFYPEFGIALQPLGEAFIKAVKMLIGPIIFSTIVIGIGNMRDLRKVGRVGLKALIYFEILTTFALAIGLLVVEAWVQPGIHAGDPMPTRPPAQRVPPPATTPSAAEKLTTVGFLLNIIPSTFVGAFASGEILQVLLIMPWSWWRRRRRATRRERPRPRSTCSRSSSRSSCASWASS